MNTIKEFLKPNRFKVYFTLTVVLTEYGIALIGEPWLPTIVVDWSFFLYPIEMPLSILLETVFPPITHIYLLVDILSAIVTWYLLSCLIYFIFKNIKGLK